MTGKDAFADLGRSLAASSGMPLLDAKEPWRPPADARTFADLTIDEARRRVGRDAIVRDDPYFGRRGLVKKVIPDPKHGFLVAVAVYKRLPNAAGKWEDLHNPPPEARRFLVPERVEMI